MTPIAESVCPLVGQAPHGSTRAEARSQALPDEDALRVAITGRGRTGAVIAVEPKYSEAPKQLREVCEKSLSQAQRNDTRFISTDNASVEQLKELRVAFPNLEALSLDGAHTVMAYESAKGGKSSPGSKFLRRIINKLNATRGQLEPRAFYQGGQTDPPGKAETKLSKHLRERTMLEATAKGVRKKLKSGRRFGSRKDLVRALAALVALYPGEMRRRVAGKATTIHTLLVQTAEPPKAEWLLNFTRQKLALPVNVMPRSKFGRRERCLRYGSQGARIVFHHPDKPVSLDVGRQAEGIGVSAFKGPYVLQWKLVPRRNGRMEKSSLHVPDPGRLLRPAADLVFSKPSLLRGRKRHYPAEPLPDRTSRRLCAFKVRYGGARP